MRRQLGPSPSETRSATVEYDIGPSQAENADWTTGPTWTTGPSWTTGPTWTTGQGTCGAGADLNPDWTHAGLGGLACRIRRPFVGACRAAGTGPNAPVASDRRGAARAGPAGQPVRRPRSRCHRRAAWSPPPPGRDRGPRRGRRPQRLAGPPRRGDCRAVAAGGAPGRREPAR